jgi:hypothetical protein
VVVGWLIVVVVEDLGLRVSLLLLSCCWSGMWLQGLVGVEVVRLLLLMMFVGDRR